MLHLALIAAALLLLLESRDLLLFSGHCLDCGGTGGHRKGCRQDRDNKGL